MMGENELSRVIVDISYQVHTQLGPGMFESVYEEILYHELSEYGFQVERQKPIPVIWKDTRMEMGFRADLVINGIVLIEIKSVESILPVHPKQVLTYLKLTGIKLGLLINFNDSLIKHGIRRIVNNL